MLRDLRFVLRSLLRRPTFFSIVVLTIGLGIGGQTAMFSLFYQVLMRSVPVSHPEQLVVLHYPDVPLPGRGSSDSSASVFSYPMYRELRERMEGRLDLIARSSTAVNVTDNAPAERVQAEVVSGNFFPVLGVRPAAGRLLLPSDEGAIGANPVAVLSYSFWQSHFGGSPSALNQTIRLNGQAFVIVGVAPPEFRSVVAGQTPQLYVPVSMAGVVSPGWNDFNTPGWQWLAIIGRLHPGLSRSQAQAALQPVYKAAALDHLARLQHASQKWRETLKSMPIELQPAAKGISELDRQWHTPLLAVMAMMTTLLLIACVTTANLLVARTAGRTREIAIRSAMGAGIWRVARQFVTESLVLACAGGLVGIALAGWIASAVLHLLPADITGGWLTATPDAHVLTFGLLVALITGVLFGVAPALQASHVNTAIALKEAGPNQSPGCTHVRWRKILIAGQIALSLVLLTGAALFMSSVRNLLHHDPGFHAENVLMFHVNAGLNGYKFDKALDLYHTIGERLANLDGVRSVGMAQFGPFTNAEAATNVAIEGYHHGPDENMNSDVNSVDPGFFRTLGIPLLAGRDFNEQDRRGAVKVAIVNEAFAKHFFPDGKPLGRHMSMGEGGPLDIEIVGVVRNSQNLSVRETPKPTYYVPYAQSGAADDPADAATFFVRTAGPDPSLAASVRQIVSAIDAGLPVYDLASLQVQVEDSFYTDRLTSQLAIAFALLALVLAAIGLYGVITLSTTQRIAEIGVRMALGADRRSVLLLIYKEVLWIGAVGVAAGIVPAIVLAQVARSQLYSVSSTNWSSYAGAAVTMLMVALAAGSIPALRAAQLDPVRALRQE